MSPLTSASSIIHLPYTPDLSQAGIAYALRSLAYTYDRMGGSPFMRLRRIVAGKAAELAFRRHLEAQGVPYDNLGATPFTDPDRYDIALGGHRCDLKSFLLSRREIITRVRGWPGELLKAAALVPSDQIASGHLRDNDLYIFAFVTALIAAHSIETQQAADAGAPIYLMYALPSRWARPTQWESLGKITLKFESAPPLKLEVGGQQAGREFHVETVHLIPGQRVSLEADFYSISYLHVDEMPQGRLGIYSPTLSETHLVDLRDWGNIWVYGMDVFLAGYLTHADFCQQAEKLPAGSRVWQYAQTRTANHSLLAHKLHCLDALFAQVKAWEQKKAAPLISS